MNKTRKSYKQTRRATTLSVYKHLLKEGKVYVGGAADQRYNDLLKRRVR